MIADAQSEVTAPRTYWERVALTSWGSYVSEVEKRMILLAHDLAPNIDRALEVGCEGGRWSALLASLNWRMVCTDIDDAALRECQARLPSATCIHVRPEDRTLPCESASTGLILCVEVPPVIRSDWFLSEARRVLTDDGIVVGVFWNLASFRGLAAGLKAALTRNRYDPYRTTYVAWRRRLRAAGFELLAQEGFCWFPFRRSSNSPLVPFFTQLERRLELSRLPSLSPWVAFVARKTAALPRDAARKSAGRRAERERKRCS